MFKSGFYVFICSSVSNKVTKGHGTKCKANRVLWKVSTPFSTWLPLQQGALTCALPPVKEYGGVQRAAFRKHSSRPALPFSGPWRLLSRRHTRRSPLLHSAHLPVLQTVKYCHRWTCRFFLSFDACHHHDLMWSEIFFHMQHFSRMRIFGG